MYEPWSELPNSHHIDWVLEILKQNPQLWVEAEVNAAGDAARHTALYEANDMTKTTVNAAVWDAARMAVYDAASAGRHEAWVWSAVRWRMSRLSEAAKWAGVAAEDAVKYVLWDAVKDAVWDAIVALVAYNDCDQYLNMSYKKLLVYASLSEKPQAMLLLPMVYVREKTKCNSCH